MDGPSLNPVDPTDHGVFITDVCSVVIMWSRILKCALFRLIQEV